MRHQFWFVIYRAIKCNPNYYSWIIFRLWTTTTIDISGHRSCKVCGPFVHWPVFILLLYLGFISSSYFWGNIFSQLVSLVPKHTKFKTQTIFKIPFFFIFKLNSNCFTFHLIIQPFLCSLGVFLLTDLDLKWSSFIARFYPYWCLHWHLSR